MKIELAREKVYDLLLIENNSLSYFKFKDRGEVLKNEVIESNLYLHGIFQRENLDRAISLLIKKHKLKVLGIVLNLPNLLYQRITLPRSANPYEAILNYLKVSFPLSLEKYVFFYKEDKYGLSPTLSNFNIFFTPNEIIDNLLRIIEKYNLIPLFIVPSLEVIYHYLLRKSLIDFNEEYIIFCFQPKMMISFLIKNLRMEKVIIEEIDLEKVDLNLIIARFYNFLKTNVGPEAKVLFFSEKTISPLPEISHQQITFNLKPLTIFLEGSNFIFSKVFADQEIVDFLPIKSYSAYFLNRLPSIIIFLSVYLLSIFFIVSSLFLVFNLKFKKEIKNLSEETLKIRVSESDLENKFFQLSELLKNLNLKTLENFAKIKKIASLNNLEKIDLENFEKLNFSLKVQKTDVEKIKFQMNQLFPEIKLIQEEVISENEVRLIYGF